MYMKVDQQSLGFPLLTFSNIYFHLCYLYRWKKKTGNLWGKIYKWFLYSWKSDKDHGQSPIHSAQTLKACISESVQLRIVPLCLN